MTSASCSRSHRSPCSRARAVPGLGTRRPDLDARRDYPQLTGPAQFRAWDRGGTSRVCFGHWVTDDSELVSEARVEAIGFQGRLGVGAVAPLVRRFRRTGR